MKRINILIFVLALIFGTGSAYGQSVSLVIDTTIDLKATNWTADSVSLAWSTPNNADSCYIIYETNYDTTTYPIVNFSLDSTTLPRANPLGTQERFSIIFLNPRGDRGRYDTLILRTIYGGIVLVEEDVFCPPVLDYLYGGSTTLEDTALLFESYCIVARGDTVEKLTEEFLDFYGFPHSLNALDFMNSYDLLNFNNFMLLQFEMRITSQTYGTWDCGVLDGDDGKTDVMRLGRQWVSHEEMYTCYPNPMQDILRIKPLDGYMDQEVKVSVRDVVGRLVFQQAYDAQTASRGLRLDTQPWKPGMYTVHLETGLAQQVVKLVKL